MQGDEEDQGQPVAPLDEVARQRLKKKLRESSLGLPTAEIARRVLADNEVEQSGPEEENQE